MWFAIGALASTALIQLGIYLGRQQERRAARMKQATEELDAVTLRSQRLAQVQAALQQAFEEYRATCPCENCTKRRQDEARRN